MSEMFCRKWMLMVCLRFVGLLWLHERGKLIMGDFSPYTIFWLWAG